VHEIDVTPLQKAAVTAQDELAKEFGAKRCWPRSEAVDARARRRAVDRAPKLSPRDLRLIVCIALIQVFCRYVINTR